MINTDLIFWIVLVLMGMMIFNIWLTFMVLKGFFKPKTPPQPTKNTDPSKMNRKELLQYIKDAEATKTKSKQPPAEEDALPSDATTKGKIKLSVRKKDDKKKEEKKPADDRHTVNLEDDQKFF